MIMPISLISREKKQGPIFLVVHLFLLPLLITWFGALFSIGTVQLNLIYYAVNFVAVLWIFRRFLMANLLIGLDLVLPVIWFAVLGYLGSRFFGDFLSAVFTLIAPDFANINDLAVAQMVRQTPLMAMAIVFLVPLTEETLYRGLVFRGLYDRNPALAYVVSMAVFSFIHVMGYIGTLSPLHLLLSFLQYLPAGYCLCFSYRRSGTILSPILMHMIVNAAGIYAMR